MPLGCILNCSTARAANQSPARSGHVWLRTTPDCLPLVDISSDRASQAFAHPPRACRRTNLKLSLTPLICRLQFRQGGCRPVLPFQCLSPQSGNTDKAEGPDSDKIHAGLRLPGSNIALLLGLRSPTPRTSVASSRPRPTTATVVPRVDRLKGLFDGRGPERCRPCRCGRHSTGTSRGSHSSCHSVEPDMFAQWDCVPQGPVDADAIGLSSAAVAGTWSCKLQPRPGPRLPL